jgi:hypothetical protein
LGKIALWAIAAATALGAPLVLYFLALVISSLSKEYQWEEMDWNGDGETTVGEFLLAGDTGVRPLLSDSKSCREIYDYKDGRSLKVLCP